MSTEGGLGSFIEELTPQEGSQPGEEPRKATQMSLMGFAMSEE